MGDATVLVSEHADSRAAFETSHPWRPVTRFAFRAWTILFFACILPRAVAFVFPQVWSPVVTAFGRWPATHVLGLPEHASNLPTGMSGADFLPDFVAAATIAMASLVLALVWSILDRRRIAYPRLFAWVHTIGRYTLAGLLLFYGYDKVLPGQFDRSVNVTTAGQVVMTLRPMELLWAFMGASRSYAVFTGAIEILGGVLLLTRRTAAVGALLSVAAMANVLMLDVSYDVSVKFVAGFMLLTALVLAAPYMKAVVDFFVLARTTKLPAPPRLFADARLDRRASRAGAVVALVLLVWPLKMAHGIVAQNDDERQSPFYGVWDVDETTRVAAPAVKDAATWKRLAFSGSHFAFAISTTDAVTRYRMRVDDAANTLTLLPPVPAPQQPVPPPFRFTFPDRDRLELVTVDDGRRTLTLHLRRIDLSTSPLVGHTHRWNW